MRKLWFGLLVLVGCGGTQHDTPPPPQPPSLIGTWAATENSCAIGYTFAAGAQYEIDTACPLADGTIGLDAEIGAYSQTATEIDFSPLQSTCAGTSKQTYFLGYSVSTGRLTLIATNGTAALVKVTPSGSGISTFGCWTTSGFTPSPLAPL